MGDATKKIKNKILKYWPIFVITLLVIILAFPYWAKSLVPFPADYLVNAFPPWQYYYGIPVKNDAMPDVITQMYPWKHLVIGLWKSKQLPLWNPYNFSGNPLLANYQSAVFHPFNFLFFVLPEVDAWAFLVLLQPLLAGLFTYLFCRQLKLSQAASFLSSVAFMFCGFITTWMAYGTMAHALLWLPLVLYGIQKNFDKISRLPLVFISLALAASFFSGHFQISLYVLLTSLVFLVFKLITTRQIKTFLICFLFVALGVLLASVQILPTFELYRLSVRSRHLGISEIVPWFYSITLVAPDFFGNNVTRNIWLGNYAEWSGFVGVIPLILAFYAFFKKKKPLVLFFGLLALISLLSSRPTPLLDLIIKLKVPVLASSAAARVNSIFSFSLAILAGLGFDKLKNDLTRKKFKNVFIVGLLFLVLVLAVWGFLLFGKPFAFDKVLIAKRNLILPTGMIGAFGILVFGFWLLNRFFKTRKDVIRYAKFIVLLVILVLAMLDLFRFAKKWMPFDSKEYIYPQMPILAFLTKTVSSDRLFGFFGMEMQNYFQIQGFNGYDPLFIQRYGELLMAANDGEIKLPSIRGVGLERRARYTMNLLNLLGGKYILHAIPDDRYSWAFNFWDYPEQFKLIYQDDKYEVYQNLEAFPRAFIVYNYEVIEEAQKIIDGMFNQNADLKGKIILEEEPSIKLEKSKEGKIGKAEIVKYFPNQVEIEAQTETQGLLFLSDNYYPGWKAFVDGKETKIYRADYSFRAVPISEGEHKVLFLYDPLPFKWGLGITLFSLMALVITNFYLWRFKR